MANSPDDMAALLRLAVSRKLIDAVEAKAIAQEALTGTGDATVLMLTRGVITAKQADQLRDEIRQARQPQTIGGFRILGTLGRGGMGVVYRALQLSMGREIALKVLDERVSRDPRFSERFLREARIAARVNDAHVVTVYDGGRDGDLLYLAMELVAGGDADRLCKDQGGKLPPRRALEIVRDAALGLAAIHAAGLLHRDIKPANVFITAKGAGKIADLGLSRPIDGAGDQLTSASEILGTPAFMSPEQARGETLDIRSDIYALGATLYALIAGSPPFTASTAMATAVLAASGPFPDPAQVPGMPAVVAALIRRATAHDRGQRPADPAALVAECERALERLTASPEAGSIRSGIRRRTSTGPGPSLVGRVIVGAVLVSAAGGAAWWVMTPQHLVLAAHAASDNPSPAGISASGSSTTIPQTPATAVPTMSDEQWRAEADARAQRDLDARAAADRKAAADLRDRAEADARARADQAGQNPAK